jgi:hypothetical protein
MNSLPVTPTNPNPELRLGFVDHAAAKLAVRRWYYREEMPVGKLVRIGVWENKMFCGVVVFGMGACDALGSPYGLTPFECCEMVRVALGQHTTPVSRIVSIALRLLKKQSPGVRAVVSFSDPNAGHIGTIYQAMGWTYTGRTAPDKRYIDPKGREWHSRLASASGFKKMLGGVMQRVAKISECRVIPLAGKYRYVWPFDDEIRARLKKLARPYPKKR